MMNCIKITLFFLLSFYCENLCAQESATIDQFMSTDEQQRTGVNTLSSEQKQALADWFSIQITPKSSPQPAQEKTLHLTENIEQGKLLILSDGSHWEIAPKDISISSLWLFPIKVEIGKSSNPNFPSTIKNLSSGSTVHARKIKGQNIE